MDGSEGFGLPILSTMANAQDQDFCLRIQKINHEMSAVRMTPDRRFDLWSFTGGVRMGGQKMESHFKFSQVPISLRSPELANALEIQRDNVVFSGAAEPLAHRLLLGGLQLAQSCSAQLIQSA